MTTRGTRTGPAPGIHTGCRFDHGSNEFPAINPNCRTGGRLDWEMLAIWVLVVFSFAALALVVYLIGAKCDGSSPGTRCGF